MRKALLFPLLAAGGVLVTLTGCTSTATATPGPTSGASGASAAPSSTSTARATPADVGTCVDGNAVVVTRPKASVVRLDGSCATVSVVGTGGTVELGAVEHLVIEGAKNAVSVASVGTIDFAADTNHVTYGGAAPTIHDAGTVGNTAAAAK